MLYNYTWEGLVEKRELRRAGLEEDGLYSWLMHIYGDLWFVLKHFWMISENVYHKLNVQDDVLDRSKQKYMLDPDYLSRHEEMYERVYQDCKRNIYDKKEPETEILTREQVIEAV